MRLILQIAAGVVLGGAILGLTAYCLMQVNLEVAANDRGEKGFESGFKMGCVALLLLLGVMAVAYWWQRDGAGA